MAVVHVLTHPEVEVDPAVAVPDWSLSDRGQQRALAAAALPWAAEVEHLICSSERKAVETAMLIGSVIRKLPLVVQELGEVDRSSTGYLPHDEHEALADELFAHPSVSAQGWETAEHAQGRIHQAVGRCLASVGPGDVALVCHGGVATLLMCRLLDVPIDRSLDQPGQGSHWTFDRETLQVLSRWERLPLPERP
jgi:broad specificity phosphatase PhoE